MSHLPSRPSPKAQPVALFVTCIIDMIYPGTAFSVTEILERVGVPFSVPDAQTCCGQMGFNAGYRPEARQVARHFIRTFEPHAVIVSPSGSCVAMVREYYPELFKDEPEWLARANAIIAKTWELTEYLVDGLGVTDLGTVLDTPTTFTLHDACHGLRTLGLGDQSRALLASVQNATVQEMPSASQCCGFGGLFAVKMPEVSGAMLKDKTDAITQNGADYVVTCDSSCLTQINGGLSRQGCMQNVVHIADVLAGKVSAGTASDKSVAKSVGSGERKSS